MKVMISELNNTLRELKVNLDKTGHYNPSVHKSLMAAFDDIDNSARRITDLVATDILTGNFATLPDNFLYIATVAIDKSYSQMYDSLLPTTEAHIKVRIAQAENTLRKSVGIALLLFLLVVYLAVGIYYAIINSIQSIAGSARSFASGDLKVRVRLGTRDELSLVGDSFNQIAHAFNSIL